MGPRPLYLKTAIREAQRALLLATALPGFAQTDPVRPATQLATGLEEVIVTGSRIPKANLQSSSPVAQIESTDILLSGNTRLEDLLKNLPQVSSAQNSSVSNGATGTATVELRDLGAHRTLVLVDGRRLSQGSPFTSGAADINQVPGALVRRVEVLTGGASATYGSDAIAGVVNFIMADDFEGLRLDYQFSQYAHDNRNDKMAELLAASGYASPSGTSRDGDTDDFSLTIGGNFDEDRGNVTAYVTYREIEAVLQSTRDYSACALRPGLTSCGGSPTISEGRFTDFGVLSVLGQPSYRYLVQGEQFIPDDGRLYNFAPLNYFQRPDERTAGGVFGRYELGEHAGVYTQLMVMDDRTVAQLAPSGLFFSNSGSLGCDNPLLSAQQRELLCGRYGLGAGDSQIVYIGRRNIEGGPRRDDLRHTSLRGVFGLRGDLAEVWEYDLYTQYAEVSMEQTFDDELLVSRINRALDVVRDPATGEPVCRAALDGSDPDCVPWDIFHTGGVTQAAVDYLTVPLFSRGTTDQTVHSGYVRGDLGAYGLVSPLAQVGPTLVLGLEYREENLEYRPDDNLLHGDLAGNPENEINLDGGFDVLDYFVELSLPLVEGKPWVEELTLDGGYRYSDYSTGVTTDTWKLAGSWSLDTQLMLRASTQRAVRVPNIAELYTPQSNGDWLYTDPCAGAAPTRSVEECALSGLSPERYGQVPAPPEEVIGQQYIYGGNPDLAPESSDTVSYGLVYSPARLDGLTASIDWYRIEIEEAISDVNPGAILTTCLDTGDPAFCNQVHRNTSAGATQGTLWIGDGYVIAIDQNISFFGTTGVDFMLDYRIDMGQLGSLAINELLAKVSDWERQELEYQPAVDCTGLVSGFCGAIPEFRNTLRLTWSTPWELTLSLMWRYVDGLEASNAPGFSVNSQDYLDLSGLWQLRDGIELRAGVNNLLDNEPPLFDPRSAPTLNGNTLAGVYDALGQYWFAGFSVSF